MVHHPYLPRYRPPKYQKWTKPWAKRSFLDRKTKFFGTFFCSPNSKTRKECIKSIKNVSRPLFEALFTLKVRQLPIDTTKFAPTSYTFFLKRDENIVFFDSQMSEFAKNSKRIELKTKFCSNQLFNFVRYSIPPKT